MMIMFQLKEDAEGKVYGENQMSVVAEQIANLELFTR